MPIIYENQLNEDCKLAVWQITESLDELEKELWICSREELTKIKVIEKQHQWLAARVLLQQLLPLTTQMEVLQKDEFGKPILINDLGLCSLSHSGPYVAAILSKKTSVGIDIQTFNNKILSIAPKFVNETEQASITIADALLQTHIIWAVKESLFKLYGKGKVDFRKNLTVMPFESAPSGNTSAYISMNDYEASCHIHYSHNTDFVLAAGILQA